MNTAAPGIVRNRRAGIVAGLAVVVGVSLTVAGWSPILLWAVVGALGVSVVREHLGLARAFAAVLLCGLLTQAAWMRLTPHLPIGLAEADAVLWGMLGSAFAVAVFRNGIGRLRPPSGVIAVSVVPALFLLTVVATAVASGGSRISWVMRNDSVTTLMFSRFILTDNGMDPTSHTNPVPLPYSLLAAIIAPGRDAPVLEHDVYRMAQAWIVIGAGLCLIAGAIGWRATAGARHGLRSAAAVVTGLIPLSWFVGGFAVGYGFFNAVIAIGLLLLGWSIWQRSDEKPVTDFSLLMLSATAMLGSWGPLAIIPLALAVVVLWRHRSLSRRTLSTRAWMLPAAAVTQFALYVALVTLPDYLRENQYLGGDGGIFGLRPPAFAAITAGVLLLAFAVRRSGASGHLVRGVATVAVASVPVLAYFVVARLGAGDLWGYYPTKFAWVLCVLYLVIASGAVFTLVGQRGSLHVVPVVAGIVAVGLVVVAVGSTPPARPGVTALSPVTEVVRGVGVSAMDGQARTLFGLAAEGPRRFVVLYEGLDADRFYDLWLLHEDVRQGTDPVRLYAYQINVLDYGEVCAIGRDLGGDATLITRHPRVPDLVASVCPADIVTVDRVP